MKTVTKKISELKSPEKNSRTHTSRQILEYIRSVEMFGQIRPVVVDENGVIICGNGLVEALKQMGRDKADCLVMQGLTKAQKYKLSLADNKIYTMGIENTEDFMDILHLLGNDFDIPGYDAGILSELVMDDTAVKESVESFGKLSSEMIEDIKGKTVVENDDPQGEYPPPTAEQREASKGFITGNATPEKVETRKYVICPKCGEQIWV